MWRGYCVLQYCRTQDTVALSSGEAELKSSCKGTAEALGVQELVRFLKRQNPAIAHRYSEPDPGRLEHCTDSSASFGIIKRKGAGQMKHLSLKQLWLQGVYREEPNSVHKIARIHNMADMMCSVSNVTDVRRNLSRLQFRLTLPAHQSEGGVSSCDVFEFVGSNATCMHEAMPF